jgi:hypothetical protein
LATTRHFLDDFGLESLDQLPLLGAVAPTFDDLLGGSDHVTSEFGLGHADAQTELPTLTDSDPLTPVSFDGQALAPYAPANSSEGPLL